MYALKNLPELNEMPKALKADVFKKLFELAKIAKMSAEQQNDYYKSLHDMSIIKIQFGKMEKTISALTKDITALTQDKAALTQDKAALIQDKAVLIQDKAVLTQDNAAQAAEIAEYRRRYGALSDTTTAKPTRTTLAQ
jgi:hypothetical protein